MTKNLDTFYIDGSLTLKPETQENTEGVNPKDLIGAKKVDLSLIPPTANVLEAVVMGLGACKYGPYNWRNKKVQVMTYLSAALRHLQAFQDGQDNDEETGVSHLASVRANMGILIDAMASGNYLDNRPPKGQTANLLKRYNK